MRWHDITSKWFTFSIRLPVDGWNCAKQELGLDDYRCQSETAWQRHMALGMLAMLFINKERCQSFTEGIYLSASDVKEIVVAMVLFNEKQQQRVFKAIMAKAVLNEGLAKKRIYIRI